MCVCVCVCVCVGTCVCECEQYNAVRLRSMWMLCFLTPHSPPLFSLFDEQISAGGGFGPVTDDGYGVSYIISSDQTVSFHVTSKKSSSKTVC